MKLFFILSFVLLTTPYNVFAVISWDGYKLIGVENGGKEIEADYLSEYDECYDHQAQGGISARNQLSETPSNEATLTGLRTVLGSQSDGQQTWTNLSDQETSGKTIFTRKVKVELTADEIEAAKDLAGSPNEKTYAYNLDQEKVIKAIESARNKLRDCDGHKFNIGNLNGGTVGFGCKALELECTERGFGGKKLHENQYSVFFMFVVNKVEKAVKSFSMSNRLVLLKSSSNTSNTPR